VSFNPESFEEGKLEEIRQANSPDLSDDEIDQLFQSVSIDSMTSNTPRFEHVLTKTSTEEDKNVVITNLWDPSNYIIYLNQITPFLSTYRENYKEAAILSKQIKETLNKNKRLTWKERFSNLNVWKFSDMTNEQSFSSLPVLIIELNDLLLKVTSEPIPDLSFNVKI